MGRAARALMIHSPRPEPTRIVIEDELSESTFTPPESQDSKPAPLPFRLPADYYATPVDAKPLFPRWVPIGCGMAAATVIAGLFIGGAVISHGGMGRGMDFLLGMMQEEMVTMYSADVPKASRQALESEMDGLRANIRSERVKVAKLDPVMSALREAISDRQITKAEVEDLRKKIREANKPQPVKR